MGKRQRTGRSDRPFLPGRLAVPRDACSWFESLEARHVLAGILPDPLEPNDTLESATLVGSESIAFRESTLHDVEVGPPDVDFYRLKASQTGELVVSTSSEGALGDLSVVVRDRHGHSVAKATQAGDRATLVLPVVAQESYWLHVFSATATSHSYSLEIENIGANVPQAVHLDVVSDTGASNRDGITGNTRPRLLIESDFGGLQAPLLTAEQARAGKAAGAAVLVQITNVDTGATIADFADRRSAEESLYRFMAPRLVSGSYLISAAVQIFDASQETIEGQPVARPITGRTAFSDGLLIQVDTESPTVTSPQLLTSSDSGGNRFDQVTNIQQPAFFGVAEANSRVRVLANGLIVGETHAGADGRWEITTEPLVDGVYAITTTAEDIAGNVGENQTVEFLEVDTLPPNTPFLDLVASSDTGLSESDNITGDNTLTFTMTTTDPNAGDHLEQHYLRYRLYARPAGGAETLIYSSLNDESIPADNLQGGYTDLTLLRATLPELSAGAYNFKLEVEDRAGNLSEDELLDVNIDTVLDTLAGVATIDLLDANDTGMSDRDNVTSKDVLAFTGVAEVGATVTILETGKPIGMAKVGSDDTDFSPGDGLGAWNVSVDPLDDSVYVVIAHIEDEAGNFLRSEPLAVEIDSTPPNTPLLDVLNDTGHSDHDNITSASVLDVNMTAEDPEPAGGRINEFNYKFRIFLRPEGGTERLVYSSVVDPDIPPERVSEGFTNLEQIRTSLGGIEDGLHNLKLEVEDRAGNISHDFLLDVHIDSELSGPANLRLVSSSDTGASSKDLVTSIPQPTFIGVGEVGSTVRLLANGVLVGVSEVQSDVSDGVLGDDLGTWQASTEPLADGIYEVSAVVEDWAGNVQTTNMMQLEIDTIAPNTPFLDLFEEDDSGRHDDDNITNAAAVRFWATTEDPRTEDHLFPGGENLRYRLFLRAEAGTETLIFDSATSEASLDGMIAANRIETPGLEFAEGLHNLKLEVSDRAGNISHEFLSDVLVDRTPFQGTVELGVAGDTGIWGIDSTFGDGITAMASPTLTGTAEANNIVSVFFGDVLVGSTVTQPFDGDDAHALATWELSLTEPIADDAYQVKVTFEDPAGNQTTATTETLNTIVVDSVGPRIDNVTRFDEAFTSLFTPKPASGPDPLIERIVVHFSDGPPRPEARPYRAVVDQLVLEEGNYHLRGDATGTIPIVGVSILGDSVGPGIARLAVALDFALPLPDDRYTLTVADRIADAAGNPLDGESGAAGPFEGNHGRTPTLPIFPTGDGNHGGDFIARFTVDSRPEIGVWSGGSVYVDTNGNFTFDENNLDFVNRDVGYRFGFSSDDVFAGNFSGLEGVADGYDKLAAYGHVGSWPSGFRWLIDVDNDGEADLHVRDPANVNGIPIAGRFDEDGENGDEVGLFTGTTWHFDTNHDFRVDLALSTDLRGYPVVGDFDHDGFDDLATWTDDQFMIDLAQGRQAGWDGIVDERFHFGFIGVRERPVAADLDQDGYDDLGLWVPDRGGITAREASEWYWLISGGNSVLDRVQAASDIVGGTSQEVSFTPRPFGNDLFAQFGDEFGIPIVGNFDPPILSSPDTVPRLFTNPLHPMDVTGDGFVTPRDALVTINHINTFGSSEVRHLSDDVLFVDTNRDGHVSPADVLLVVNYLNDQNAAVSLNELAGAAFAGDLIIAQTANDEEEDDKEVDEH